MNECEDNACALPTAATPIRRSAGALIIRYAVWMVLAAGLVLGLNAVASTSSTLGLLATAALAAIVVLRRRKKDQRFAAAGGLSSLVSTGKPTVLEVASEMCGACLAMKPAASQLKADLGERAAFVRLSVLTSVGRSVASDLGIQVTPTYVTFGADGREIRRDHKPPALDVVLQGAPQTNPLTAR